MQHSNLLNLKSLNVLVQGHQKKDKYLGTDQTKNVENINFKKCKKFLKDTQRDQNK